VDITDTNNLIWEDGMSDLRDIATLRKEIDCLTEQVDTLRKERDNMGDWIDLTKLCKEIDDLTAQVETLHKERDEARRDLCVAEAELRENRPCACSPQDYANRMKWDCFKSDTLSQEVSQGGQQ
jgi:predicted  nucleic acid-binding Zn-ribbon protein